MKKKIKFIIIISVLLLFFVWLLWDDYKNTTEEEWERIEDSPEQGSGPYRY